MLWVVLGLAVAVLVVAAVVIAPILLHSSAGGSGQQLPTGFVAEASATGADGRTRTLSVETENGEPADMRALRPGDVLVVTGTGYDAAIGIYVSVCRIPSEPDERPSPCLGGLPEGAMEGEAAGALGSSAWITDAWAWRAFATQGYDDAATGSFVTRIIVPASSQDGLDCTSTACGVTTRADHTALKDRVQDMQLPVQFEG